MRKQTWLAAVILSCGVLMAGCGSGNRSYQKGIKAMQAGDYEDAGTFFKKAIKENDERAEYYIAYGMYLNEQGEYEEAVKQFERAYQDTENTIANVNNKQVYLGEAIAYTHLQKYEKALSLCKRALKLTNTASLDNRIWCSEGVVLEALNRPDEALTAYRNAVKGNKENWQAYFRMGVIYQNNGDSDAAGQAQEYLLSASQKGDREAGYYLGMLYLEQQDKVKAKKYLEKYIKNGSGEYLLNAYNSLATLAIEQEDYSQADEYLSKARRAAKGAAAKQLWKNQMLLMERQGLFGEALSIAQEYLKQYPDDQAMKKECRFLKTRNEVAKGNEAVQSQTSDAGTSQTTGSDDTGDNTAAGTGADNDNVSTSATRATATKAPQSQTSTMGTTGSTAAPKSTADTGRTGTSTTTAPTATRRPAGTTSTATPAGTASPYIDTQESVN